MLKCLSGNHFLSDMTRLNIIFKHLLKFLQQSNKRPETAKWNVHIKLICFYWTAEMSLFFIVAWNDNNDEMRERATRLSALCVPAKKQLFIKLIQSGYCLWSRHMLKALMNRIYIVSPTNVSLTSLGWPLFASISWLRCFVSVRFSQMEKHLSESQSWCHCEHTEAAHQSWKITSKTWSGVSWDMLLTCQCNSFYSAAVLDCKIKEIYIYIGQK